MSLKFGTDGVRGVANSELTPELVMALGRAAARHLHPQSGSAFLVGRDTRVSGPLLQAALTAGLAAEGIDVLDLGVMPTPGIAAVANEQNAPAAVISASHNPFSDNGIKFFSAGGRKLPDEVEEEIEAELTSVQNSEPFGPSGAAVGRPRRLPMATSWYSQRLVDSLGDRTLEGLRVVLDCANGAAFEAGPEAFRRSGAEVVVLHDQPNGTNINDACGSTHPESLQAAVVQHGAHLGLAFDGDADRVLAVDEKGALIDGDHIIALCALDLKARNALNNDTVVVTVMSNLGFRVAMQAAGVAVIETQVGDRYVLEALEAGAHVLGGEQSGHVVFRDRATTGDGLLTGLTLCDIARRSDAPFSKLASAVMTRFPQVLKNVEIKPGTKLEDDSPVWAEVRTAEAELGDRGRVLLRPSGTEPLIRVMVEAETLANAESIADRLCAAVSRSCA